MMRLSVILPILRNLHLYPMPLFQAIRDPLRIRVIEPWLTEAVALLAALMVHSGVVSATRVQSDGNGDLLARPSGSGARVVAADKAAHDIGVVFFCGAGW
jgi:hypothetical protein